MTSINEPPELLLRRQARAQAQTLQAASYEKHLKIAQQMALGGEKAEILKNSAMNMLKIWKERNLCSPVYIEHWYSILNANPHQIAENIINMDYQWALALRQNTPFAIDIL